MKRCFYFFVLLIMILQSCVCSAEEDFVVHYGFVTLVDELTETDPSVLKGVKIGIDPGHQRYGNSEKEAVAPGSQEKKAKVSTGTRGTVTGTPEYEVNLTVSLMLRDVLTALGAEVRMTRESNDVDISNQERATMMNEWGADFVVRIHCNGASSSDASGISVYTRASGTGKEESRRLALLLLDNMVNETQEKKLGAYMRDSYTGLNWSTVPCVLVEMGFMTNPREDRLLNDTAYQEKLVRGMVNGMMAYVSTK